jgi:histidinol phosphatase-like enzyme (inositol monophosphatase family)
MSKELNIALKAAEKASDICREFYESDYTVELKEDKTPVSEVDKKAEQVIIETIKAEFPDSSFLGEESGEKQGDGLKWIIDPIDGTKNFIRHLPDFGVSIALENDGELVLGVITLPVFGKTYHAVKGKGAFLGERKIQVSKKKTLSESTVYMDMSTTYLAKEKNLQLFNDIINAADHMKSSGAVDALAYIAEGKIEAFICPKIRAWDIAAGKIIIEEAGGKLTDFNDKATIYSKQSIASNGLIHQELVDFLGKSESYL